MKGFLIFTSKGLSLEIKYGPDALPFYTMIIITEFPQYLAIIEANLF